jgi:hypothetical protein
MGNSSEVVTADSCGAPVANHERNVMINCLLKKIGFAFLIIAFSGGVSGHAFAGEWEKPWSSVKGAAKQRCERIVQNFQLQAICMQQEKDGYDKMKGNFGLPSAVARNAKERCERIVQNFQLQAVCMQQEKDGYDKMKSY